MSVVARSKAQARGLVGNYLSSRVGQEEKTPALGLGGKGQEMDPEQIQEAMSCEFELEAFCVDDELAIYEAHWLRWSTEKTVEGFLGPEGIRAPLKLSRRRLSILACEKRNDLSIVPFLFQNEEVRALWLTKQEAHALESEALLAPASGRVKML
jgi:hypothetical protein